MNLLVLVLWLAGLAGLVAAAFGVPLGRPREPPARPVLLGEQLL